MNNKSKKEKSPEQIEGFDLQFKNIIKNIIKEEEYFKKEDVKILMKEILEVIDPLIAKHVKEHIKQLCCHVINKIDVKIGEENDAKTS